MRTYEGTTHDDAEGILYRVARNESCQSRNAAGATATLWRLSSVPVNFLTTYLATLIEPDVEGFRIDPNKATFWAQIVFESKGPLAVGRSEQLDDLFFRHAK